MELKIAILIIVVSVTNIFATATYSQVAKVTLDMNNKTLEQVMDEIEKQSEFYFIFNQKQIDVERVISVYAENNLIGEVLRDLFDGTNINYAVFDRKILLTTDPIETKLLADISNGLQQNQITGTVTDEKGSPLPGVNVVVKNTTTGAFTDANGKYTITVPNPNIATLVFSFVGYTAQEISLNGKVALNITLVSEAVSLEEVVVVGYGTQKKVNLTGAVSAVTSERLENRPIASTGLGLQGLIPNLNISVQNGDPTTPIDYNIRGFESINGGSPLILVDGVPMDLDRINPEDIESVNVLKDAGAAAIYGSRAAFGVILVETKNGEKGKLNISLNSQFSLVKPIYLMNVVTDPFVYVNAYNDAYYRTNGVPFYDSTYIKGTKRWVENPTDENAWEVVSGVLQYYGNNDYQHELVRDYGPQSQYTFDINGASEKASYYVSFGYLNKDGVLRMSDKNQKYKRYNILMKSDFKVNSWLTFDEKISFNAQVSDQPFNYHFDVGINTLTRIVPIMPLQFPDLDHYVTAGDHDNYAKYIGMYFEGMDMLPYLKNGGRTTFTANDIWLTQGITITPLKGLKLRGEISYNTYHKDYQDVASKIEVVSQNLLNATMINNGYSGSDYMHNSSNYNQYYVFNTYAEYLFNIKSHNIKTLIGFNQEWGRYTSIDAKAFTLLTPTITDISATTGTQQTSGSKNHIALRGAFFRLNYAYKDRYLLESDNRYDGSSRFPKDSRFKLFSSISLGWRISNEKFMANTRGWLDNLKLRASYGVLGNQLLDDFYPYVSSLTPGLSPYIFTTGSSPYVSEGAMVSPELTWEKVSTQNIGLDVTLFKQRLNFSFDAYIRDTKDMLLNIEYPDILGADAPAQNGADLRTKGWESSIDWHGKIGKNWQYGLRFALSDNQSEITKYENPAGALSEYYVGKKIGEIWGYKTLGIFQTQEEVTNAPDQSALGTNWRPGDVRLADLNDDKKITAGSNTLSDPGDMTVIGNTTPRYSFGINPDLSYKDWTLNVFFQGLFRDYLPGTGGSEAWTAFYPFVSNCVEKYYITESWTADNPDAYFPANAVSNGKNWVAQSRWVQNAAYIRLKNITLNYNLPYNWINKIGLSKAQIYLTGMNLLEYTKMHKPLDPESITTLRQEYYLQRIYTFGVKVTF